MRRNYGILQSVSILFAHTSVGMDFPGEGFDDSINFFFTETCDISLIDWLRECVFF